MTVPAWQAWAETAVLAGAAVLLLHGFRGAGDPLLQRGTPWLALAPLLAGLRYGSKLGAACGAAGLALAVATSPGTAARGAIAELALGLLVAGLLTGAFRDAWSRRLAGLAARTGALSLRLEGLGRAYHALEASHDRLRLETGARSTLREALDAFRRDVIASPPDGGLEPVAARVLDLLREVASVQAATLHPVDGEGRPGPSVAALGPAGRPGDDALVLEAARSGQVVSVRDAPASPAVLAAVPLVDVSGRVHAVVAVRDMPFLSLHADTLTLLAVLGGHAGDVLARMLRAPRQEDETDALRQFCASLARALRDVRELGVPAALAVVELKGPPSELAVRRVLARHVAATRRLSDEGAVVAGADGNPAALLLLRLADEAGLLGHRRRLERLARERAGELGSRAEIRVSGWPLQALPLPRHPRELAAFIGTLLARGAPGTEGEVMGHGIVA